MDWQRRPSDEEGDPTGLADLLRRAQDAVGEEPLLGTRFVHDADEMLRATREIESSVSGVASTLWVGFQRAEKLVEEFDVYRDLTRHGTEVQAFGEGEPDVAEQLPGLTWTSLPRQPYAFENQWFLVTRKPEPVVFAGFETSPEVVRGKGGAGSPAKNWEGFVSSDDRLVDLVVGHLESVVRHYRDS